MEIKNTEYEVVDGIATIALNRPHRMNAWTGRLHTEYRHWLSIANDDAKVQAIVVTGRGKGFCVGGDSKALEGHSQRGGYDDGTSADIAEPAMVSTIILMQLLLITSGSISLLSRQSMARRRV